MRPVTEQNPDGADQNAKTVIDGHPLVAKLGAFIGIVTVGVYWFAFTAFGSSSLPWQIALVVEVLSPSIIYIHYLLNHRTRRLFWEGIAACIGLLPFWMLMGSTWIFYFGFAPMPSTIRMVALTFWLTVTAGWIWLTWRNYTRATRKQDLMNQLYLKEASRIVYPQASDFVVARIESPGPSIVVPYWLVSTLGPVFIAYAMVSGRVFEKTGGPHGVFIILSVLGLPISCWMLSNLFLRTVYFHIYLPLKLESETGKKVILAP